MLLEATDLRVDYGPVTALHGVSIALDAGEMVALIGANGAGKTTLLKALSGLLPLAGGRLTLRSRDISTTPAHERVALGLAHVPEGRGIFPGLSVLDNLELGAYARPRRQRRTLAADISAVLDRFPRLAERRNQAGGTLSGGEQQMLAIGRSLLARPSVLLLDEPSMGLAPKLVASIFQLLTEINAQGTTVLLVEQNAAAALACCRRGYVLELGHVVRSASSATLAADDSVRAAYLGMAGGAISSTPSAS